MKVATYHPKTGMQDVILVVPLGRGHIHPMIPYSFVILRRSFAKIFNVWRHVEVSEAPKNAWHHNMVQQATCTPGSGLKGRGKVLTYDVKSVLWRRCGWHGCFCSFNFVKDDFVVGQAKSRRRCHFTMCHFDQFSPDIPGLIVLTLWDAIFPLTFERQTQFQFLRC